MTIISVQNLLEKCHGIKFLHVIKFWRPLYAHLGMLVCTHIMLVCTRGHSRVGSCT
jgi:hypothetical protein